MAKSREKNIALKLRGKGESIRDIANKLGVSKNSVSLWCCDIKLTAKQIKKLHQQMVVGSYEGRIKGAQMQHEQRLQKIENFDKQGAKDIGKLSKRDFLLSGLALYWGEGAKKNRRVKLINSDPLIIQFMMGWFREIWQIKDKEFILRIGINQIHKNRVEKVEKYWSKITSIPKTQFGKTTLIKSKNKKSYDNFHIHYGTLTIEIRKSAEFFYQIMGLIKGLTYRPRSRLASKTVS